MSNTQLVEVSSLSKEMILSLYNGEILAIRYSAFLLPEESNEVVEAIFGHPLLGAYGDGRGTGRLGPGVYELILGDQYWEEYKATSSEITSSLRTKKGKLVADKVREELAKAWGLDLSPSR